MKYLNFYVVSGPQSVSKGIKNAQNLFFLSQGILIKKSDYKKTHRLQRECHYGAWFISFEAGPKDKLSDKNFTGSEFWIGEQRNRSNVDFLRKESVIWYRVNFERKEARDKKGAQPLRNLIQSQRSEARRQINENLWILRLYISRVLTSTAKHLAAKYSVSQQVEAQVMLVLPCQKSSVPF